jgi:hypothetical protein
VGIFRLARARLALAGSSDKIPKSVDKFAALFACFGKNLRDLNTLRTKHELIPAASGSAII